jgi:hypothetical protein
MDYDIKLIERILCFSTYWKSIMFFRRGSGTSVALQNPTTML